MLLYNNIQYYHYYKVGFVKVKLLTFFVKFFGIFCIFCNHLHVSCSKVALVFIGRHDLFFILECIFDLFISLLQREFSPYASPHLLTLDPGWRRWEYSVVLSELVLVETNNCWIRIRFKYFKFSKHLLPWWR